MGETGDKGPERVRIVVADDSADMRESTRLLLEAEGYEVLTASDGAAAILAVEDFRPHVCLIDIGMPVRDGHEVARVLRSVYGSRCPYLIAISGQRYSTPEDQGRRTSRFDRFIAKGTDARALLSLLRELDAAGVLLGRASQ